jgi:hypothetical protein
MDILSAVADTWKWYSVPIITPSVNNNTDILSAVPETWKWYRVPTANYHTFCKYKYWNSVSTIQVTVWQLPAESSRPLLYNPGLTNIHPCRRYLQPSVTWIVSIIQFNKYNIICQNIIWQLY